MPKIKIKPSDSADVVGYAIYHKEHDPAVPIKKGNASRFETMNAEWENPGDGYLYYPFDKDHPEFGSFDGYYDFGIAAIDDATPPIESPLFSTGLLNIGLDFVAPNPITEASIVFG